MQPNALLQIAVLRPNQQQAKSDFAAGIKMSWLCHLLLVLQIVDLIGCSSIQDLCFDVMLPVTITSAVFEKGDLEPCLHFKGLHRLCLSAVHCFVLSLMPP